MQRTSSHAGRGVGRLAASVQLARRAVAPRWKTFGTILGASVVIFCMSAWPFTKAHLQAVAVMRQVAGQPVPRVALALTMPVTREELSFPIGTTAEAAAGGRQVRARLYQPTGWTRENRPHAPAMVVFHGVHHLGIDEPRLVGFAAAMASCGIRVLTPELPGIKDYHVSADSVETIGESVKWFAEQTGGPVGVMGLSFSGGLALVAAADPLYHADFRFVLAVGSQDSMARVSDYYLTGKDVRPDGTVQVLAAHEYGPLVLEYEHLEDFIPSRDLKRVRAVLRAHLYEDKQAETNASLGLNEAQKLETLELMDATSAATRARIAAMMRKHTAEIPGLSPLGRLKTLDVPVYLLHGEADNIIPSAETLWMASELRDEDLQAMLVSPILSHLDLDGARPDVMDEWRLVHFFALIMNAAEKN